MKKSRLVPTPAKKNRPIRKLIGLAVVAGVAITATEILESHRDKWKTKIPNQ